MLVEITRWIERRRFDRRGRELVLASLATFLLTQPLPAQTFVKFSLNGRFEGPVAPFLVAADKGYYKAEGVEVAMDSAANPLEPITRVAGSGYDVAFGDVNALMKFRDQSPGAAVKAVFMVYNRPPYAIIGRKSRGIRHPKDLEDKKLGAPPMDPAYAQWPLFAQLTDIDTAKVTILNVGMPVREPMLASGEVDAVTGSAVASYVDLKERGVPADDIDVLLMADYGLELYGDAILVNAKFAAENPEAVKGFLRGYLRGLRDTVKNPSGAVESVLKRNEETKKETELEQLRIAIKDNILTAEVRALGYGGIDTDRFDHAIEQMAQVHKFKTKPKVDDIFDASFLPPEADRKVK